MSPDPDPEPPVALQTSAPFDTPFGIVLDGLYWRWTDLRVSLRSREITVTLEAFKDAAAGDLYAEPKQSVAQRALVLTGNDFWAAAAQIDGADPLPLSDIIYAVAMEKDEYFAGATEV